MKSKNEAPEGAATPTRATVTKKASSMSNPVSADTVYHTPASPSTSFVDLLGVGEDAARHAADLSAVSGLSAREIRLLTESARRAGVPVCAGQAGYWLAGTESEKSECARSLRLRGQALLETADALDTAELPTEGGITNG